MSKKITVQTQRELLEAPRTRYRGSTREEKTQILREFPAVSGYHCKPAIPSSTARQDFVITG